MEFQTDDGGCSTWGCPRCGKFREPSGWFRMPAPSNRGTSFVQATVFTCEDCDLSTVRLRCSTIHADAVSERVRASYLYTDAPSPQERPEQFWVTIDGLLHCVEELNSPAGIVHHVSVTAVPAEGRRASVTEMALQTLCDIWPNVLALRTKSLATLYAQSEEAAERRRRMN